MTKALIEEAREAARDHSAMARFQVRSLFNRLADALAARQPTEDDREAAEAAATDRWGTFASNDTRQGAFERDAFVEGYMARAAVPDAATEREIAIIEEHREKWMARAFRAEDERNAALAAVERIRQAVSGHPECDRYEEGDVISCGWKSAYASVVAALDEAPEPEWEYALQAVGDDEPWSQWYESRELLAENLDGLAARDDERLVRRRKAGPWLPVEGEKP